MTSCRATACRTDNIIPVNYTRIDSLQGEIEINMQVTETTLTTFFYG